MRTLSNGYGLIQDQETEMSYLLNPTGMENWGNSDQTLEKAKELVEEGQGTALSIEQLKDLSERTKGHAVLA